MTLTEEFPIDSEDIRENLRNQNQVAYLNMLLGKLDTAYVIHDRVMNLSVAGQHHDIVAETDFYLGELYFSLGHPNKSLMHLRKSITYLKNREVTSYFLHRAMSCLARVSFHSGNISSAKSTMELIESTDFDGMLDPYSSVMDNLLKADLALKNGESSQASQFYQTARQGASENSMARNLSYLMLRESDFNDSRRIPQSQLNNIDNLIENSTQFDVQIIALSMLSDYYGEIGRLDRALEASKRKSGLESQRNSMLVSLNNIQSDKIAAVRTDELQYQLLNKLEDNKTRQIWIFLAILVALYLTGFAIVFRRLINQKNKSQRDLAAKNIELINKSTQITETQSRLIQSEKMAVLGRLSSGIAHELNTPIGAIKGNVELIHDLQSRELDQWFKVSTLLKPDEFKVLVELMKAACEKKTEAKSTEEEREIQKKVAKFFKEVEIENKEDVIDIFSDLYITENLNAYTPLYGHEHNVEILELALYVFNRSNSVITAKTALAQAEKILHSFRTYSFRRGWEDFKSVDVKENIEVVISLHKNTFSGVDVDFTAEGDTKVIAVPDELSQVWSNILNNAIEAMKGKGNIKVSVLADEENVRVEITDNGGGIHLEPGQDIFDPFFTTKKGGGSGLGMDLTRQIIQKHEGTINWKNTDKGVTFTIILPKNIQNTEIIVTQTNIEI